MKLKINIIFILLLSIIFSCTKHEKANGFIGFWEGPHPEDITKKFYIQFIYHNNEIAANGFWTKNGFYDSEFMVDSIKITADSVRFYVPIWNCYYTGMLCEDTSIQGGFRCKGEPFDPVCLTKNDEVSIYLTQAKPHCTFENYQYSYNRPVILDDNISVSGYQSAQDSLFIYSIIPEIIHGDYGRINSFLLLKDGKLICEEYFYGYTHTDLHQIESSTKSITSLLIGIAKDEEYLTSIHEPLYKIFPDYRHLGTDEYSKISIYHLLTMTSGYDTENDAVFHVENRIDHVITREIAHQPGNTFVYDGGNTEILGAVIKAKTGIYADEFADKYLFTPLNIKSYNWDILKQDGFPCMGGSLELRPRDMAKIGLLVLNKGKFNNQQIISQYWIEESTSVKVKTNIEGDSYAYHWWNIDLKTQENTYETIWANGLGSQFIYIIPELNVVIVTTGFNYEHDSWAITDGIRKYIYLLDN